VVRGRRKCRGGDRFSLKSECKKNCVSGLHST